MNGDDYGYDLEFVVWCAGVLALVACAIAAWEAWGGTKS